MKPRGTVTIIVVLGALAALDAFSVDATLPAMPAMARGLATGNAEIQFSLSAFILGLALAQPFFGPASDRFGRRPILISALCLYVLATVGCALAPTVTVLSIFRLAQGIAAAAGQILVRAIVRDLYHREAAARIFSYVFVVFAVAPIVAPIGGAYLAEAAGWPAIFMALAAYAAVMVLLALRLLGETIAVRDPDALDPARLVKNYVEIIRNPTFCAYLACATAGMCGLFAYLSGSAAVLISYYGTTPEAFGYWFALSMSGNMVALFVGGKLVEKVGLDRLLMVGTVAAAASGIVLAALAWAGVSTVAAIVFPVMLYLSAFALIMPQATAGAMSPFGSTAGAASSVLGFVTFAAAAGTGALIGWFDDGTQLPMTNTIFVAGMAGLVAYFAVHLTRKKRSG